MKPEEQIIFLAELLNLINELQELVKDHCRVLIAERDGTLEKVTEYDEVPF